MKKTILSLLVAVGLIGSASAQTPTGDLANGLVSFYSFNGNANDLSGNANNANVYGNYSYLTSGGVRIYGDGSERYNGGGYINVFTPGITQAFTISIELSNLSQTFWAQEPFFQWGTENYNNYLVSLGGDATSIGFGHIRYGYVGGGIIQNINNNFYSTKHVFTLTQSADTFSAFIDGYLIGSTPDTYQIPVESYFNIGAHSWIPSAGGFSARLNADITSLAMYNTALSSSQVSQLYTLQSAPEPSQVAASLLLATGIAGFLIVRRQKNALALVA